MNIATKFAVSAMILGVFLVPVADALILSGDPNAQTSGAVNFDFTSGSDRIEGIVEYAVYSAADYLGFAPTQGAYVYAYQIYNSNSSNKGITTFSVGIPSPDASVFDIYADTTLTSGLEPWFTGFSPDPQNPQSAEFLFMFSNITPGSESAVLVFSSNDPWTFYSSTITGGGIGGMMNLPAPIPEPSTIAFMSLAMVGFFKKFKK